MCVFHRKRYDRAEKELIEAKLDLHEKIELKDHLTEHLYTVINQNEIRKAKKLAELMDKLELDVQVDDVAPPVLVSPCSMPPMIPAVEQAVVTHMTPKLSQNVPVCSKESATATLADHSNADAADTVITVAPSNQEKVPTEGAPTPTTMIQEGDEQKPTDTSQIAGSADSGENASKDLSSNSGSGDTDSKSPSPAAVVTESDKTETK